MFGIGTGELLLILVIAMLVVGPERMVDYARRAGVLLAKLRAQTDEVTRDFREALQVEVGDGEEVNPLAALTQIKSEAEEAVRDLQAVLTGAAPDSQAPGAKDVQPATAAQDQAPAAPPTQPATPPVAPEQSALADARVDVADAVVDLEGVELIDDQEGLELVGPMLIEAVDADEDAAQESEGER
jgi:sec-independent protein translocase protein TatB